jgi:hypothetical protein
MPNRTVKVQGWGTGTSSLVAELDGQTIFSGDVVLTEFNDETATLQNFPILFSFEIPIEFEGTKQMKIRVGGVPVRFGMIVANYTEVDWNEVYYTGHDEFGDISPMGEDRVRDPRRNVCIDGVLQEFERQGRGGTWHWIVNPGSVLEHDLLIKAGVDFEL